MIFGDFFWWVNFNSGQIAHPFLYGILIQKYLNLPRNIATNAI